MLMEITGLTMFPTILTQVGWFFKDSVTALARWRHLEGPGQGSPGGCMCSKSVFSKYKALFLPQPGLTGPGIKG